MKTMQKSPLQIARQSYQPKMRWHYKAQYVW